MTLGLDTSVVVRLIVGEPASLVAVAKERLRYALEANERVLVSDLVFAESYFVLQHHYELSKSDALAALRRLAASGDVEIEAGTLAALEQKSSAGLVDRLIQAGYRAASASTLTFDRRLARHPGVELLKNSRRR